ncbi:murein hydrolase regulator LrgA [Bacillus methanolicus]|uniref:CidA/LrgA family protein n=1 Tax=Bacillus methanolicus TaxID=1471 RepID=UPI0023809ECE|nr:CidA/LrgA family protein [Bacillus methanolicus]MDE3838916.1 murein hydrolase regulator LrgA [Bacillus methanolicus]
MKISIFVKFIFQLFFLISLNYAGSFIAEFLHIPISGNVIGMILLFILLTTGIIRIDWIETAANVLIKHLGFFFIPISVGLMTLGKVFINNGLALMIILFASAFIGIAFSGLAAQTLLKRKEGIQTEYRRHTL